MNKEVSLVHFDMPDYLLKNYNGFMNKEVIKEHTNEIKKNNWIVKKKRN